MTTASRLGRRYARRIRRLVKPEAPPPDAAPAAARNGQSDRRRYDECEQLIRSGQVAAALDRLHDRVNRNPRAAQSLYLLGIALLFERRFAEARAVLDRAFALKLWVREFESASASFAALVEEAGAAQPDWAWPPYRLARDRYFSVGLELSRVVGTCLGPDDVFVVQVGANPTGRDPLQRHWLEEGWDGLLVEPLSGPAAALRQMFAGVPGATVVQAAVDEEDGERSLFLPREDRTTLASFFPDRTALGRAGELTEEKVRCATFATMFAEHGVEKVDFLQIDTEGYDYRVLRQFDFERFRPAGLQFEFYVLPLEERLAALDLLDGLGYAYRPVEQDLLAVDARRFADEFCVVRRS